MGAGRNGNLLYLYLPNWHVNVVKYDDLSSSFKLWYPEPASIRERYCTLFDFGNILLSIGSLYSGLINAWFRLAGSRHSLTVPFGFGTNTKLFCHSAVSPMPSGPMMSYCCMCSNSSLNGHCRAYAMHHWGAWYCLLSGLTCNENVPLKHPILLNASLNSLCGHCLVSVLTLLSLLLLGPGRKYLMLFLLLSVTVGLSLFSNFELSVFV